MGASENWGYLIIRILLFRVLYSGPLFSETPIYQGLKSRSWSLLPTLSLFPRRRLRFITDCQVRGVR